MIRPSLARPLLRCFFSTPSRHVTAPGVKAHKAFADPAQKREVQLRGLNIVQAFYSPDFRTAMGSRAILDLDHHPKKPEIQRMYEQRPRDCLWWYVRATLTLSGKRVVRSWAQRRVRVAFKEALASRGLDADGRAQGGAQGGLLGSLRIQLNNSKTIEAKFVEIQQDVDRILNTLLKAKPNGKGQQKKAPKQRPNNKARYQP